MKQKTPKSSRLLIGFIGMLLLFGGCRKASQPLKLTWTPQKPRAGDTLRITWNRPVTGFLWVHTYEGSTPFLHRVQLVPITPEQRSHTLVTTDSVYLVLLALDDTAKREILAGPEQAVVFYDPAGKPIPLAREVLATLYFRKQADTLRRWLQQTPTPGLRRMLWGLLAEGDTLASTWLRDSLRRALPPTSRSPAALYHGWRTAFFLLQDTALARQYLQQLQKTAPHSLYTWRARFGRLIWTPEGRVRRSPENADTLWQAYQRDPRLRRMILGSDLLRWYLTYHFVPLDRHAAFRDYLEERLRQHDLTGNDLVVLQYVSQGWLTNRPDTALQTLLVKIQERWFQDPLALRQAYGLTQWQRLSRFYRDLDREREDYLKLRASWALDRGQAREAYRLLAQDLHMDRRLFDLWAEDLDLFGRAALAAGHPDQAEQALAVLRFYHADTSADSLLRRIWHERGDTLSFEQYLATLEQRIQARFPRAPDFEARTLSGDTVRLQDLHGRVVVLNFWATWCGPCRREIPELNDLVDYFQRVPQVVFLAFTDEDSATAARFLKEHPFRYRILPQGRRIREAYRVNAFPTHFVLSPDGRIVFKQVGYMPGTAERLKARIEALLR